MKNVHVLPTHKPSRLFYDISMDKLVLASTAEVSKWFENKNIYITSDEEIKEGDYGVIGEVIMTYSQMYKMWNATQGKKIILTTDQDLIKDGVQAIDDGFLEWFVKNPSCEEVEVIYLGKFNKVDTYKIIIPKEELSKDEIDKFFVDMVCNQKQETIEEAAINRYAAPKNPKNKELMEIYNIRKTSFIDGAKSQAAKEYWFEQFKKNKL